MAGRIIKDDKDKSLMNTAENRNMAVEMAKTKAVRAIGDIDFDTFVGSKNLYILDNVFAPIGFFKDRFTKKFEFDDILEVWQAFLYLCKLLNEQTAFAPTLNTFCNFLNMSTTTFKSIMNENTDRGELCRYISDVLSDRFMQMMLEDKLPQIPSIFVAKANFGMRDNDQPVTNIVVHEELKSAMDILEELKKG